MCAEVGFDKSLNSNGGGSGDSWVNTHCSTLFGANNCECYVIAAGIGVGAVGLAGFEWGSPVKGFTYVSRLLYLSDGTV